MRALEGAINLLDGAEVAVARGLPASSDTIEGAEFSMGIRFPQSYREFLALVGPIVVDRGNRVTDRLTVSGLPDRQTGVLNVRWRYGLVRSRKDRAFLNFADQDRAHHEPRYTTYSLELFGRHAKAGEVPVLATPRTANAKRSQVADSFGIWLEDTLKEVLPDAVKMWQSRVAHPTHRVTIEDPGEPYRAFEARCECGWRSQIFPVVADAEQAARWHSDSPEHMRAEAYWI